VDYEPLSINLTFSRTVTRIDFNVTIVDDSVVEQTEVFEGRLTAVTMGPSVILNLQNLAQISILDDRQDSKSIPMQASTI
jgi:hexokinase